MKHANSFFNFSGEMDWEDQPKTETIYFLLTNIINGLLIYFLDCFKVIKKIKIRNSVS